MRINIRDSKESTLFGVEVDMAKPPSVVKPATVERGPSVNLDWERAVDDEGHLRRCPVCGCEDLFVHKKIPQLTLFVGVVFAAVVAIALLGLKQFVPGAVVLVLMVGFDVAIFLWSPKVLQCYRCHSQFRDMPIPRGQPRWEQHLAERYRQERAGQTVEVHSEGTES